MVVLVNIAVALTGATPNDFSPDKLIFYRDLVIFRANLVTFFELDALLFYKNQ